MRAGAPGPGWRQGTKRIRRENTLRPSQQETEQDGGNFLHVWRDGADSDYFFAVFFSAFSIFFTNFSGFLSKSFLQSLQQSLISRSL